MKSSKVPFVLAAAAAVWLPIADVRAGDNISTKPQAAAATDATLFPIPNLQGSFFERDRLLGDGGGFRQTMAEHGVQLDFNLLQFYQGVMSGGDSKGWSDRVSGSLNDGLKKILSDRLSQAAEANSPLGRALSLPLPRLGNAALSDVIQNRIDRLDIGNREAPSPRDADYLGQWTMELKLDTNKMGLWPGGFFFVRAQQVFGSGVNARSGALLPVNAESLIPAPGLDGVVVPQVYFTQFLCEHAAITLGKLDTLGGDSNEFAHIAGDDRFIGSAFSFDPVVAVLAPYSPLGIALTLLPTKNIQINLSVIDGDGVPTQSGFDTLFKGKTSYVGEGKITTNFFGKLGHQVLGGAIGNGHYAEFKQDLRAFVPGSGVAFNRSTESWCLYYNFDQYFWSPTTEGDRGIGVFGRVGFADPATSPISQFYSIGLGGKAMFTNRPHDKMGLGYYCMKTSYDLPAFLHLGNEQGVEAFYDYAVTPAFLVTADLQMVDSAKEGIHAGFIGSLRATMRF